jgi:hypothetical protein
MPKKNSIDPFIIFAILQATSHAEGAATSLLLRVHADESVSPSYHRELYQLVKTFEELPLDQVNRATCENWKEGDLWRGRSNNVRRDKWK